MPYKDPATRKSKQKHYSRTWYQKNQARQIRASRESKKRVNRLWNEYKAKQKCSHCGFQHPAVIDFHHVIKEGKRSVNKLIKARHNLKAAISEAEEKCIPLCSNCHRIFHWEEHNEAARKRRKKHANRR